ncbi:MAG: hypothetical protein V3V96_15805 [Acidiferrobacterales bacterium]
MKIPLTFPGPGAELRVGENGSVSESIVVAEAVTVGGLDVSVETGVSQQNDEHHGPRGPYWSDVSTAAIVYIDNFEDLRYTRTTDGGTTWADTLIKTGSINRIACWFDKETPGDTGTKLHIIYMDFASDTVFYRFLDIASDTARLGTERTIDNTVTIDFGAGSNRCSITKTVGGNLLTCFQTTSEIECNRSTDEFATSNDDRADVYEAAAADSDYAMLFPANTADNNDACAVFIDRSAFEVTLKMYDDSANTWTEFATIIGAITSSSSISNVDAAVRHSDNHVLVAWHRLINNGIDDLLTSDLTVDSIASPTVTAKTDIFTDQDNAARAAMLIDQNNDDVYVAYLKGGTYLSTMDVVFHKSTDGMATWDAEQAYNEADADDIRAVHAGRSVSGAGGHFMPAWYNEDLTEIFVNLSNDISIA